MQFSLDEVVSAREAARGFSGLVERLRQKEQKRIVILYRNRPEAVLLHVSEYVALLEAAKPHLDQAA